MWLAKVRNVVRANICFAKIYKISKSTVNNSIKYYLLCLYKPRGDTSLLMSMLNDSLSILFKIFTNYKCYFYIFPLSNTVRILDQHTTSPPTIQYVTQSTIRITDFTYFSPQKALLLRPSTSDYCCCVLLECSLPSKVNGWETTFLCCTKYKAQSTRSFTEIDLAP